MVHGFCLPDEMQTDITARMIELHALQGHLCSCLLRKDMEKNKATSELACAFLEYGEHVEPDLLQSCAMAMNLKRVLTMCQRLEGLPGWVREGRLALDRFEVQLTSQAKAEWKALLDSHGIDHTLKMVEGGKLGQVDLNVEIDGALAVLKQGKTLSELSKFDLESATLVQKARYLLTVSTLQVEAIKFFFPDVMETVSDFKAKVTKMVMEGLDQISASTKPVEKILSKYRRGAGLSFFLQLHCSCSYL